MEPARRSSGARPPDLERAPRGPASRGPARPSRGCAAPHAPAQRLAAQVARPLHLQALSREGHRTAVDRYSRLRPAPQRIADPRRDDGRAAGRTAAPRRAGARRRRRLVRESNPEPDAGRT